MVLDGQHLRRSEAHGKYLFVHWGDGTILHIHLGLIGKFRPVDPATPTRSSIRLRLTNDEAMWDLTGPSRCDLVTAKERREIVAGIGPDPLRPDGSAVAVAKRMAATSRPIGAVLLDQRVIAGLGNIYRAEILFLTGIRPDRPSRDLRSEEIDAIWAESQRLLRIGVRTGRIITTDPSEIGRPRSRMRRDDTLYVYHREHCRRCGTAIRTVVMGGRPIQFCPRCQPD